MQLFGTHTRTKTEIGKNKNEGWGLGQSEKAQVANFSKHTGTETEKYVCVFKEGTWKDEIIFTPICPLLESLCHMPGFLDDLRFLYFGPFISLADLHLQKHGAPQPLIYSRYEVGGIILPPQQRRIFGHKSGRIMILQL